MMAELAEARERNDGERGPPPQPADGETANGDAPEEAGLERRQRQGQGGEPPSHLFYLDPDGKLAMVPVTTGITDGQNTVVEGPSISEGMQIIAAVTSSSSASAAASNPFQSQSDNRPPGGGPPR
jgi:hypothetical protein